MQKNDLLQLDRTLESTWKKYEDFLKQSLLNNNIDDALFLIEKVDDKIAYTSSGYPVYRALTYFYAHQHKKALEAVQDVFQYGCFLSWMLSKSYEWSDTQSPEYLLVKPLLENEEIQQYVTSVFNGKIVPYEFNSEKTPLCWFEKIILNKQNIRCHLSKKKLPKGKEVYKFYFFNGSSDIPTDYFIADIETFHQNLKAVENLKKYQTNTHQLSDYNFRDEYDHPYINYFWHTLKQFNFEKTIKLIATPPVNSSPYVSYKFNEKHLSLYDENNPEYKLERKINYGTGGEFLNLLYVLVKCGYFEKNFALFPQLPEHFPLLFMCFDNEYIRKKISEYLSLPELPKLYEIALRTYSEKKPEEVLQLIEFGKNNPTFRKNLATSLNLYEYHLYSNYRPGAQWFFQDFQHFVLARGGGLLDFLVSEPELIPALHHMKKEFCCLTGLALRASDTYSNSFSFFYRTMTLHSFLYDKKNAEIWMNSLDTISSYERCLKVHKKTMKVIEYLQKHS